MAKKTKAKKTLKSNEDRFFKHIKQVFYVGVIVYSLLFSFLTIILSPIIEVNSFLSYLVIFLVLSIIGFLVILGILYLVNKAVTLRKYLRIVMILLLVIQAIIFLYITFVFVLFSSYA